MNKKGVKAKILQHWFGVDAVLFNAKSARSVLTKDVYEQYLTTKGAFLVNLFEMYTKMGYNDKCIFETVSEMVKEGISVAQNSKKRAKSLIENTSVTKLVKEEIKEMGSIEGLNESQVAKYVIWKRRNAIALDAMMLETVITKENKDKMQDWQGKVLQDAHKTLRNNLIDIALQ